MDEKINEHLKEIGASIFEAKSAYTIWKTIAYSRSVGIVSETFAKNMLRLKIQLQRFL